MVDNNVFENTFQRKLIYVFRINDAAHEGYLKIGDATINSNLPSEKLIYPKSELKAAAEKRIDSYTDTASIEYELLYAELAIKEDIDEDTGEKVLKSFRDHEVHKVLKNSGIKNVQINDKPGKEWFKVDLETVKNAIKAVKDGKKSLSGAEITNDKNPIIFRPEQKEAIELTVKRLKKADNMLWNAKMRFGKTLCALQVAKELENIGVKRTIIATHRPVVNKGWHDDFKKIFYDRNDYFYITNESKEDIKKLEKENKNFIYFASIQDLRGSEVAGGKFDKNVEVFEVEWDLVIIDEAHEGTTTEKGENVKELLTTDGHTKVIELSGTPFNIINKYEEDAVYTWDYMMEQSAKRDWDKKFGGDSNPYEELPQMKIYTYDLGESLGVSEYEEIEDKAFNFKEFFRTWTENDDKKPKSAKIGDFVHEEHIIKFLNLISADDKSNNYPYTCEEYRNIFKHSLWMVPGVKEAKALSSLMKSHKVFGNEQFFEIVNIAGDGDEEDESTKALEKVEKAIKKGVKNGTYTITLSCGKLTTGVTIPEWTAVMMLSGSYSTSAANYLQTIFRVQSPANINGMRKEYCYVFDFAPDRTLKMVADAVQLSTKAGKTNDADRRVLGEFLNFCPVISISGTRMEKYNENKLLQQLKRAYADRAVKSGFEDSSLYNDYLLNLDNIEMEKFNDLKKIVGSSKPSKKINEIPIANTGLTKEERAEIEKIQKKPKRELTPEDIERLQNLKEQRENANKARSILRAISVRIPLLVFGGNIDANHKEKEIDKVEDLLDVDEDSWEEFMPSGVTKERFQEFMKYYDTDVFSAACKRIRNIVKYADTLAPTERVIEISKLFSYFKNPDKETVLTPWRVVNMHLGDTLGGYNFYEEGYDEDKKLESPRFIDHGGITNDTLENKNGQILEINSKTGLYPLYAAYSIFRTKCPDIEKTPVEEQRKLWNETVKNNIYVICKTPMAKYITKRTLVGFYNEKINAHYFEDLINTLKNKSRQFVDRVNSPSYWNKKDRKEMKFDAVVGNPPYQGTNHQQIYPYFYLISRCLGDYATLIFPTGWQEPKNANNLSKMNNEDVKRDKQIVFIDNKQNVFPGISGAEWTNIILWKNGYDNNLEGNQLIYTNGENPTETELLIHAEKVEKPKEIIDLADIVKQKDQFNSISMITSVLKPYGLRTDVIKDYKKYGLEPLYTEKKKNDDIKIYAKSGLLLYVPKDYKFPKKTKSFNKYKLFVPYAWGNMAEKTGLGGAYSDIIIAYPNEACTETYLESGCFDDYKTAKKHAKYLMTNFTRALLYVNKTSQHSTTAWGAIPTQDYTEPWWNKSIKEIDAELIKKYNVPQNIAEFIKDNIQTKTEENIINYQ